MAHCVLRIAALLLLLALASGALSDESVFRDVGLQAISAQAAASEQRLSGPSLVRLPNWLPDELRLRALDDGKRARAAGSLLRRKRERGGKSLH